MSDLISVNNVAGAVSIGSSSGKTVVMNTGGGTTTTTNATTIHTYTVTTGRTFYLEYVDIFCRFSTLSATLADHGSFTLKIGASNVYQAIFVNSTTGDRAHQLLTFGEPIPIASGTVIQMNAIAADTTSRNWRASFGGYEKVNS